MGSTIRRVLLVLIPFVAAVAILMFYFRPSIDYAFTDIAPTGSARAASSDSDLDPPAGPGLLVKGFLKLLYGPVSASIAATFIGIQILAAPLVLTFLKTRHLRPAVRWSMRGAAFGFLALPIALFLYLHFFTDPFRAFVLGFPGVLLFFHFEPFGGMGRLSHGIVLDPVAGSSAAMRRGLPGFLLWPVVYGLSGFALGQLIEFRTRMTKQD